MLIPRIIIPNLSSCSELRRLGRLSVLCMCRYSACLKVSYLPLILGVHWHEGEVFHIAGSKDETFFFRSKEIIPEHEDKQTQVNLRVGKTAERSRLWRIPSLAKIVRDPSEEAISSSLVLYQCIRTMDTLYSMLIWTGCLF